MTIPAASAPVTHSGDGTSTAFAFPYKFLDAGDLQVVIRDADGEDAVQELTTHYTVSGAGEDAGGTVTFLSAPAAGEKVIISLDNMAFTQGVDLDDLDDFPAESVERALDRLTLLCQRLLALTARALRVPVGESPVELPTATQRALRILGFDGDGVPVPVQDFSVIYQGAASSDPSVRITGEPIEVGDLYFNTVIQGLKVKTASGWQIGTFSFANAGAVVFTPAGGIAAANVQAALEELDAEKLAKAGGTVSGSLTVTGAADLQGDADVGGNATVDGTLGVIGNTTLAGDLAVGGDTTLSGSLTLGGETVSALPLIKAFESAPIAIPATNAFSVSAAHGLGARPALYFAYFRCVTGEHNYSTDDEILWTSVDDNNSDGFTRAQLSTAADATNVTVGYQNGGETVIRINDKSTGEYKVMTRANWRIVLRAYL